MNSYLCPTQIIQQNPPELQILFSKYGGKKSLYNSRKKDFLLKTLNSTDGLKNHLDKNYTFCIGFGEEEALNNKNVHTLRNKNAITSFQMVSFDIDRCTLNIYEEVIQALKKENFIPNIIYKTGSFGEFKNDELVYNFRIIFILNEKITKVNNKEFSSKFKNLHVNLKNILLKVLKNNNIDTKKFEIDDLFTDYSRIFFPGKGESTVLRHNWYSIKELKKQYQRILNEEIDLINYSDEQDLNNKKTNMKVSLKDKNIKNRAKKEVSWDPPKDLSRGVTRNESLNNNFRILDTDLNKYMTKIHPGINTEDGLKLKRIFPDNNKIRDREIKNFILKTFKNSTCPVVRLLIFGERKYLEELRKNEAYGRKTFYFLALYLNPIHKNALKVLKNIIAENFEAIKYDDGTFHEKIYDEIIYRNVLYRSHESIEDVKNNNPRIYRKNCNCEQCQGKIQLFKELFQSRKNNCERLNNKKQESKYSLEEVRNEFQNTTNEILKNRTNQNHIINAPTGVGKTQYLIDNFDTLTNSNKKIVIAFKTHNLVDEFLNKLGPINETIIRIPEIKYEQLHRDFFLFMEEYFDYGIPYNNFELYSKIEEHLKTNYDYEEIKDTLNFLDVLKTSLEKALVLKTGIVITTHERVLNMDFKDSLIIFDEEPSVINFFQVEKKNFEKFVKKLDSNNKFKIFFRYLVNNEGDVLTKKNILKKKEDYEFDFEDCKNNKPPIPLNLIFSENTIIRTEKDKINIFHVRQMPKKYIIFTATPSLIFKNLNIDVTQHDINLPKQLTNIEFVYNDQVSRTKTNQAISSKNTTRLKNLIKKYTDNGYHAISYKILKNVSLVESIDNPAHFHNTSGFNSLTNEDLVILGVPRKPRIFYICLFLYLNKKFTDISTKRYIEIGDFEVYTYTYFDDECEKFVINDIQNEICQAIGRCRPYEYERKVYIEGTIPSGMEN